MATLTIRNIDDTTMERLRVRATAHGHSIEEEVRAILTQAVVGITGKRLWELSRELFGEGHGVDLELPPRGSDRPPPDFGE